jgi:predicted nuclease of predicted toxin-antitoxin system
MAFSIKADENMPRTVLQILLERGYDTLSVIEQGMGGWKDPDLWKAIQEEKRFLITADKGFADIRMFPPGSHAGILLLRPDEDGIRPLVNLLRRVLDAYSLEDFQGTVTVASPRSVRIRKA